MQLGNLGIDNPEDHAQVVYTLIVITWESIKPLVKDCVSNGNLDAVEAVDRLHSLRDKLD